ncbi:uncharacterized protein Z520_08342 [Fonsecaea multimorphosa CBS 102226]|uniref:Uncharacterized protein n=1 Tax=Fonsecaea multimorphosa CBS 102226 TaxID=1442371 RepID=A0A0D2JRM2_9EURO|nr:uncharacterized protein Z520_08342 [Fonsecaea multimorphosa CBS 102226]KIX96087.1 hypothetical protein Z520_08342 [Fonsecaea multimorphosa CBS 102226]OAL21853.1 hypothetical protein AYO22_07795 [Fonsecaea multimorphosa]
MKLFPTSIVLGGLLLRVVHGISVQENYTICNWARLRAGVIRDALYLDGGLLWWQTAFADGTAPVVSSDGNVEGDMFVLNFSTPFDTTKTNVSGLFDRMSKAGGAGNNIAPNYVDGTMFTNDGELYLYGGLPRLTDSVSPQSAETVLGYEAYQYGPDRTSWSPGFYQGSLPDGVTRYITNGAGVSAPSENLGFYFSGMRSPTWGPIYYEDSSANVTANTLIEVDMSVMRSEKWTNTTLPDNIQPRANAELVWIPVSDNGVLVAIGGVTAPEEIWATGLNGSQTSQSEAQSPGFMTTLPVYDIASSTWYLQNTTGQAPGQLTEFCSVVATAKDSSSFNVYIYGGYDGLNADDEPSDDVWILSIPSFQWIKAYSGNQAHGRSGHRCVTPYPDQMFVIGGVHQNQAECVEGGIIQIFNLNNLEFQNTYDPSTWSDYQVPAAVTKAIGGNGQGGSTKTAAWSDGALAGIFAKSYSRQITHYYPYPVNGSSTGSSDGGHSGVSKGAIIGISVAAAVMFILLLILLFLLIRRRRIINSGSSEKSSHSSNSRITRWLNGASCAGGSPKRPSPHHQSSQSSPPEVQQVGYTSLSEEPTPPLQPERHEMANNTERPKPPYELATPYNNLGHPRHSGIVDYAYNANFGHTHSQSASSEEVYRPSPLSNSVNGNGNGTGPTNGNNNGNAAAAAAAGAGAGAAASRLRRSRLGAASEISSPSAENSSSSNYSSTGTNETLAWPFPATQNNWRGNNNTRSRNTNATRFPFDRERSSESSSVQPIIEEQEEPGSRRQSGVGGGGGVAHELPADNDPSRWSQYQHGNESASSGIGTLPSPTRPGESMPQDEEHRRSLFSTISPVSPTVGRNWRH